MTERSKDTSVRNALSLRDLAADRDLNSGFGDAMAKAFEMALTPSIFGGLGWLIDRRLGTAPIFLISLFLFTSVYVGWKMLSQYETTMRIEGDEMRLRREKVRDVGSR